MEETPSTPPETNICQSIGNYKVEYPNLYNGTMHIKTDELISLLKCHLCCGILRNPTTINECMHSFCKSCIYKWFCSSNSPAKNSCPDCGVKLGGRPLDTLIFDNSLSLLVDILFPEFEAIDKANTKKMYATYRAIGEALPGDDEIKHNKPNLILHLYPLDVSDEMMKLPMINKPVIMVERGMDIGSLKEYISRKIKVAKEEFSVVYKNQEMPVNYTFDDIERLYGFDQDKNYFYYMKRILNGDNVDGNENKGDKIE